MSFLDEIIDPLLAHQTDQTETTSRRLGVMIATALIDSDERVKLEMKAWKLSEAEAQELCNKLKDCMPTMGYHSWPHSVAEFGQAIRYAVDKDTFYNDERTKK